MYMYMYMYMYVYVYVYVYIHVYVYAYVSCIRTCIRISARHGAPPRSERARRSERGGTGPRATSEHAAAHYP